MTAHARRSDALPTRPQRVFHGHIGVAAYPLAAIAIMLTLCCALPVAIIAGCIIADQKSVLLFGQVYATLRAIPQQICRSAYAIIGAIIDDGIPAFPAWMRMKLKKLAVSIKNLSTAFVNTVHTLGEVEQTRSLQTPLDEPREEQAHSNNSSNAGPIAVSRSNDHSAESSSNHGAGITSTHSPDTGNKSLDSSLIWKAACDIAIIQGRRSMTEIPPSPLGICAKCIASNTGVAANMAFKSCYHSMGGVYIVIACLDAQEEQVDEDGQNTQAAREAREKAHYRALLKSEMLRWHPDRFCALPDEHREHVQIQAKELFQIAQTLLGKEMKEESTVMEQLMLWLTAMWSWLEENWRTAVLVVVVFVTVEVLQRLGYI